MSTLDEGLWRAGVRRPALRHRDFGLIVAVAAVDVLLLSISDMSLAWSSELPALAGALLLAALYGIYSRWRVTPRLAGLLRDALRLLLFTHAAAVLSYLVTALPDLPLRDSTFDALDRLCGFDWLAYYDWFQAHPTWLLIAKLAYDSAVLQIFLLLVTLSLMGRRQQADDLFYGFAGCGLLVVLMAGLLPASGAFVLYHVPGGQHAPYVIQYLQLRSGTLTRIDLAHVQGLVWFPSFHAVLAGLFVYAARGLRWLFWPLLALNTLMLAACPVMGGHYLVDLPAGLVLLAAVIFIRRREHSVATPVR